jgi:GNAT superfamily N-acetyltransferase
MNVVLSTEEMPDPVDVQFIYQGLAEFNRERAGNHDYRKITVFLKDDHGSVHGGLIGSTYWDWFHLDILWIEESLRGNGWGSKILQAAEEEAIRRHCLHVHLDTMSFQALPFYQKHGYQVFGVLHDMPSGHRRYYLKKTLTGK